MPVSLLAAESPPAGGADPAEAILVTVAAGIVTAAIVGPLLLYKAGRFAALGRVADTAASVTHMPGWAALPGTFLGAALLIAVFGMYWDISLHIDNGRDEGPLANPAHYFILIGLYGVFIAGLIGAALPEKPTRTSIQIWPGWHAPIGAIMIAVCGAASLSAFPLDDIWHRIFGQDVTLWGPTHLMLIGGASLSVLGGWALHVEGDEERRAAGRPLSWVTRSREIVLAGAFLVALSTFQAEFDFSVPQFSLWLQPIMIMLAAGIGLVAARVRFGPGGALAAVLVFVAIRGVLALLVGPVFGQTVPTFPLYVVEALVVEVSGLLWMRGRPAAERPVSFGALCGLGIGTIGLAAEWAWNQTWVVNEWVPELFPEGALLGFAAAIAGGVLGGFVGRTLRPGVERTERMPKLPVPAAAVLAVAVVAFAVPLNAGSPVSASFDLTETELDGQRAVTGTVTLDPPDAAEDALWFQTTSWQGGSGTHSRVAQLEPTDAGPGTYEITEPIPVEGTWKTTLRLHDGRQMAGLPVFLPADEAIPVEEEPVPAAGESRQFILDKGNLQRELKDDVPGWLTLVAYVAVGLLSFGLIAIVAWGLLRLERLGSGPMTRAQSRPGSARAARLTKPPKAAFPAGGGIPHPPRDLFVSGQPLTACVANQPMPVGMVNPMPESHVNVEELLARTPYLIADGEDAQARFARVTARTETTRSMAKQAAQTIASQAEALLGPYETAMRSDLVAESNRMEGYDVSAREVNELVRLRKDLLDIEVHNLVEAIRDDAKLLEALGLYRAYGIADDWAGTRTRPREFELRSLHGLVLASHPRAGQYKEGENEIGGSDHVPLAPWDVPRAMGELTEWFETGSGDPVLDAAVVHAWLTHIHPFDDGNGRVARLLANMALVQADYPPLLLRSTADRGPYLEALASSDEGDILPLYQLFEKSLRRSAKAMLRPDFVQSKIRAELFSDVKNRYTMWRELMRNFTTSLEHKTRRRGWRVRLMGYPSIEDFAQLEARSKDGNTWFTMLIDPKGRARWSLFFGYQSRQLLDIAGGRQHRCWPSVFVSRPTDDPRSVHPWEPVWESDEHPVELSFAPGTDTSVTVRQGFRTDGMDLTDATALVTRTLCK